MPVIRNGLRAIRVCHEWGSIMQAVTVETAYFDYIVRKDVRVSYRGKSIEGIEPCVGGKLWRIYYNDVDSTVVASTAVCVVELVQKGVRHAK